MYKLWAEAEQVTGAASPLGPTSYTLIPLAGPDTVHSLGFVHQTTVQQSFNFSKTSHLV